MSRVFNAYAFHLRYRAAMRASRDDVEPTEKEIAGRLAVSRSTLYRLRVDFDCPRGSSGLTDEELDALGQRLNKRDTSGAPEWP